MAPVMHERVLIGNQNNPARGVVHVLTSYTVEVMGHWHTTDDVGDQMHLDGQ